MTGQTMFMELLQNLAVLVTLSMIYGLIMPRYPQTTPAGKLLIGGLFGSAAILGMTYPFILSPGVVFDGRSILMCLAGFLGGWVSAIIAALIAVPYRFFMGGSGALTGSGVIVTTALVGVVFHHIFLRWPHLRTYLSIYLMGFITHLAMLLWMLTLQGDLPLTILKNIGLPVIALYPLATLLIIYYLDQQGKISISQKALRESEDIFIKFMEHSPIYVFFKDENIRAIRLSKNFETMLGRPIKELIGKTMDELFPSELAKCMMADDIRTLKEGREITIEEEFDGRFYTTIKFPIFIDGKPCFLAGYTIDITERKHAEAALLEAEARYHILFDNAPDGIVICDPETARILEFNETACRQLGYSRDEFSRLSISDIDINDTPEIVRYRFDEVLREGRVDFETRHRTKSGEIRTVHITLMTTEISGRRALHCVLRDITERRRLQDQLRHAQKLESIGQLAGGIAHDFNNVLNAVVGYAGMMQMDLTESDPMRHFADEIAAAAMRGASLTTQILAFSRKQTLEMRPVNINEVILSLEKMLHRLVREDIIIKLSLPCQALFVMADAAQIDQVLINLTTNARDAMPNGGEILISTNIFAMNEEFVLTHGYGRPGKYALITFSDSGCGMDEETRLRIFDPFFTTKEIGRGTGLGLAVVHGILKQHGGFVDLYSEPGKGTVFNIYLPLTDSASEEIEVTTPIERRGGTETILIAEDDASLRKLSGTVLTHFGYRIIEAVDGEDAILKFSQNSDAIELVILDCIMPKKNGGEAYESINRLKPGIKTIFMSGYADESFPYRELFDKTAFIRKPMKPDELLHVVRETLDAA
jgi:two-component system, cell cycle sensor histidine kinase and response regulator CckA